MNYSALDAIHTLADQYGSPGKTLYLRHLSLDCAQLLAKVYKTGELPPYEIVEVDPKTDPVYGVAEESSLYADVGLN
jgi:SulP family sulfate permease